MNLPRYTLATDKPEASQKHRRFGLFCCWSRESAEIDLACVVNILAVCNKHKVSPIKPQALREEEYI